ncbi:hypothetical protein V6N11_041866 [Hibiscus sabdariffa]|uniref:Cation/H+ exchanger transmembrane domain-containing protein n=1 Tax=Hibiscus sabdariffa TaxID=183260 RepID=A0ABR1ZIK3_9ROSI
MISAYVYNGLKVSGGTYWQTADPVMSTLPVFLLQLSAVIMISRVFNIFLRPLRQPRYLSELLAAVLLGPRRTGNGWLGNRKSHSLFEAGLFLETMANLGVTFYMFLVGLEMDLTPLRKIERTALTVAIAGIVLPVAVGVGVHTIVLKLRENIDVPEMGAYFWSIALSHTSFPDLARILSDLKLMYTDLGKTALTAALVNDISCSFLLVGSCIFNQWGKGIVRGNPSAAVHDNLLVFIASLHTYTRGYLCQDCWCSSCLASSSSPQCGMVWPLGLLMNTKGVLAVIIINEGRNMKGFDQQNVFLDRGCHSSYDRHYWARFVSYTHRSARHLRSYNEMHLERRRTSAMLIFHDKNKTIDTGNNCSREKAEAEQIVSAFESFENEKPWGHYRFANIILIPFTSNPIPVADGTAENLQHELVNQNLLQTSPCSIGLLVDRGLTCFPESQKGTPECRVSMLFVEGPDDREALAYAWRMAGSPKPNAYP